MQKSTVTHISEQLAASQFPYLIRQKLPNGHHERVTTCQSATDLLEFALKQAFETDQNRVHVLQHCSHTLLQLQHAHFSALQAS